MPAAQQQGKREALPTFLELAENKLSYAGRKDKIITIKVCVNTARMMVEAEKAEREALAATLRDIEALPDFKKYSDIGNRVNLRAAKGYAHAALQRSEKAESRP